MVTNSMFVPLGIAQVAPVPVVNVMALPLPVVLVSATEMELCPGVMVMPVPEITASDEGHLDGICEEKKLTTSASVSGSQHLLGLCVDDIKRPAGTVGPGGGCTTRDPPAPTGAGPIGGRGGGVAVLGDSGCTTCATGSTIAKITFSAAYSPASVGCGPTRSAEMARQKPHRHGPHRLCLRHCHHHHPPHRTEPPPPDPPTPPPLLPPD